MLIVDSKIMSVVELLDMLEHEIKIELEKAVSWGGSNKDIYRLVKMLEVVDKGYYSDELDYVIEELGHEVNRGIEWEDPLGARHYWTVSEALNDLYLTLLEHLGSKGDWFYNMLQARDLSRVCEMLDNEPILYNDSIIQLLEDWGYRHD